jgi:hypothetical protein
VVQTEARGETGATLERMGGEEGIVPERSEWFRSSRIIGTWEWHQNAATLVLPHLDKQISQSVIARLLNRNRLTVRHYIRTRKLQKPAAEKL